MTVTLSSPGSTVPNWTLLQTATPTGVSTYTFSGLSGYAKYRIKAPNLICTTSGASLQLRINGDTGANYSAYGQVYGPSTSGQASTVGATALTIGYVSNSLQGISAVEIDDALLLTPKQLAILYGYSTGPLTYVLTGMYFGTNAVISSLTVLLSANNFSTGSIYLEGAN